MCESPEIPQDFPEPVRGVDYDLVDGGHGFLIPRWKERPGLESLGPSVAAELANVPTQGGNRARDALRDAIVEATGVRPRTKTIRTSAFNAALHPPKPGLLPRREPDAGTPLWEGPVLR